MEAPLDLLVLYTHRLRGSLDLLPRLYTFLRRLKQQYESDLSNRPSTGRFLLLDLGESCAPGVWHCDATGGRSMLVALDAMGCHAANASALSPQDRARLSANLMQMALVDAAHSWEDRGIRVSVDEVNRDSGRDTAPPCPAPHHLHILLQPRSSTTLDENRLFLKGLNGGQVGAAQLSVIDCGAILTAGDIHTMPLDTSPDSTIAGVVDFVLSEARLYQQKKL